MRAIFISYRREDTEGQAGRLFKDLVDHFGEQAVFMDVDSIEPGRDFRKVIDEHVASCGVLLALIGKDWLDAKDAHGQRRIDGPGDFVRLETASALKRDIPVVPVLVQGARMPSADQMPPDLADLAYRNAMELTHARWDSDVAVLAKALARYVTPAPTPAAVAAPPEAPRPAVNQRKGIVAVVSFLVIGGALVFGASTLFKNDDKPADTNLLPDLQSGNAEASTNTATTRGNDHPSERAKATQSRNDVDTDDATTDKPGPNAGRQMFSIDATPFGVADWDHDGFADMLVRDSSGVLWLYPGRGRRMPGRIARVEIGSGWKEYTPFGVTDWDRDGHQDIVAREDSTGSLWLYPGQSKRSPSTEPRVEIGNGWNGYTSFGLADWDRDKHQDIVTRDPDGNLWIYPGESKRAMSTTPRALIGNGWNSYAPFGIADWDHDGHQDIVTRNSDGDLKLYPGESQRTMSQTQPSEIGTAWNNFVSFGLADWDRDGHEDIVAQDATSGDVWLFAGQSKRTTADPVSVKIGEGRK